MTINDLLRRSSKTVAKILDRTLDKVLIGKSSDLSIDEAAQLLSNASDSYSVAAITLAANVCREIAPCGDKVTYVINRNINFTNACIMRCGFCAFSRTGVDTEAYFLPLEDIISRAQMAASLGATEVCVQAGLPPNMNPELYPTVARGIKEALPNIHLHAFSPEEVLYGAKRRKCTISDMVRVLKDAGVDSLPGTSAEILVDEVREIIAKGRLSTAEWIEVISAAHANGISTTATMMYGHVEKAHHVATHLSLIRDIQRRNKGEYGTGFTEFVPLSFVAKEAPMWKSRSNPNMRCGPTGTEVLLTHAVARLMLAGHIDNIQVSWVKEGVRMAQLLLGAGVNDLGGTLMNESISTSAGASHGQLTTPLELRRLIRSVGRTPVQRHTNYSPVRVFPKDCEEKREEEEGMMITKEATDKLEDIADPELLFGSFHALTKESSNRFKDAHKRRQLDETKQPLHCQLPDQPLQSLEEKRKPFCGSVGKSHDITQPRGTRNTYNLACVNNFRRNFSSVPDKVKDLPIEIKRNGLADENIVTTRRVVTYSSSYTIVPTYECFNACSYCNFRTTVRTDDSLMLPLEEAEKQLNKLSQSTRPAGDTHGMSADHHRELGVDEILVLSGEVHPRSSRRRGWLQRILDICDLSLRRGFLPHTNAGPLSESEMEALAAVNASMGLMVEQTTPTLMDGVHKFAPNKRPELRLQQLRQAGELKIAFTTGVLLGVGESKQERLQSLRDIASIAKRYGHIQEVILQPYTPGSKEKLARERGKIPVYQNKDTHFDVEDLPVFVEEARQILPADVAIQIPPNLLMQQSTREVSRRGLPTIAEQDEGPQLSNDEMVNSSSVLMQCVKAGATDFGGISPFDEVNPDWPFPPLQQIHCELSAADYTLQKRLPIYPRLIESSRLSDRVREVVRQRLG